MPKTADVLKVGGFLAGHTLSVDDNFVEWKHVYGRGFKVPRSAVQVVLVEKAGWGKADFKLVGNGAELAKVPGLPVSWAEQAQKWLMERLGL